jgi:hypothetical protein
VDKALTRYLEKKKLKTKDLLVQKDILVQKIKDYKL